MTAAAHAQTVATTSPRAPVPPWLTLAAGAAATVLVVTATGDVLLLALGLAAVASHRGAVAVLLVGLSVAARTGAVSLVAVAGAQAVLGPAGLVGPPTLAASTWLGGAALVLAAPSRLAAVPLGLAAGFVVAGPAAGSPSDMAVRAVAGLAGVAVAVLAARHVGPRTREAGPWRWLPAATGAAAFLLAVAPGLGALGDATGDATRAGALAAVALAAAAAVMAGREQWVLALGALAAGAAAAGVPPAFWFAASAAVVVAAMGHRAALMTVLPAAVVAVDAALAHGGIGITAVTTGLVATAALGLASVRQPPRLGLRHLPALGLGAGLLLVPHQWSWTGIDALQVEALGRTGAGAAAVVATAAVAVVGGWVSGQVGPPRPERTAT